MGRPAVEAAVRLRPRDLEAQELHRPVTDERVASEPVRRARYQRDRMDGSRRERSFVGGETGGVVGLEGVGHAGEFAAD